jgi:4-hydroxy 2-oxovalerate aldolase
VLGPDLVPSPGERQGLEEGRHRVRPGTLDRAAITQGYAGVYSSFLLHAERAAERYAVPAHEILQRVGELGYVGGQEDMIIDVALSLQRDGEHTL